MDHIIVEIYANKASKKGVPNNHDKKKKQNKMLYSFAVVFPLLVTLILIFSSFSS